MEDFSIFNIFTLVGGLAFFLYQRDSHTGRHQEIRQTEVCLHVNLKTVPLERRENTGSGKDAISMIPSPFLYQIFLSFKRQNLI